MQGLLGGMQRFAQGVNGLLYPGFNAAGVDPETAKRAQAQAMMQMGMGLLGGAPAGQAYAGGMQAGFEPIEQSRREAMMRAATQDRQAEAKYREAQLERQQKLDARDLVNDNRSRMYRRMDKQDATKQQEFENNLAMQQLELRKREAMRSGSESPASVREFEYFSRLPPEQQQAYLRLQGGGTGASKVGVNPMTGRPEYFTTTRDGQIQWLGSSPIDPNVQAAQGKLPGVQAQMDQMASTVDATLKHPGLSAAVGLKGPTNYLPGTEAQGFIALNDQIQGQAFLQAFESLKGGGQITQIEGEKATAAIARLSRAQSEKDYKAALLELKGVIDRARKNATMRATYPGAQPATQAVFGMPPTAVSPQQPQSRGADFYYGN